MKKQGRLQTPETRKKITEGTKRWFENLKKDPIAWSEYRLKQAEGTRKRFKNKEENRKRFLIETPFENLGQDGKRDKVLLDQNNKCSKCGNYEWFGEKLILEIDHINGNHQDNNRENLVALCPNCHSITPTWRGRNKFSCKRVSDEEALEALKSEPTIRQALVKVGLTPKGGNYKRFTRLKKSLDNS